MPSSGRRLAGDAYSGVAVPFRESGDPVWLSHGPVDEAGKRSVNLASSPKNPLSVDDGYGCGYSPNPSSTSSSTRCSLDDCSSAVLEWDGTQIAQLPIRLNFIDEDMEKSDEESREKVACIASSSPELRRYKDIWSTVKLAAETSNGATCVTPTRGGESDVVATPLPSEGSHNHASGQCKPCAFFHQNGCQSGSTCKFCHLCPPREVQRRKRIRRRISRQQEELSARMQACYSVYPAWANCSPYMDESAAMLYRWGLECQHPPSLPRKDPC